MPVTTEPSRCGTRRTTKTDLGAAPEPLFDVVLKVHRYMVEVNAYVLLMTDDYPKFGR